MEEKRCAKCKKKLPLSGFDKHKQSGRKTWIRNICKKCNNARARERREKNRVKDKPDKRTGYYKVLDGGGYFRGLLPITGFVETVKAGHFPDGMIVERTNTKKVFMIDGKQMVPVDAPA